MSKLETNTIDTVSGTSTLQVGSTNTSTITLGVSGDTINVPSGVTIANSGTATGFAANTPAFKAYYNGSQTIGNNSSTKITVYGTEEYDTDNCYDNSTNYRFTPTTAGKYFVYGNINAYCGSASNLNSCRSIFKQNGTTIKYVAQDFRNNQAKTIDTKVSFVIDMNGSSDYLELFALVEYSSSNTITVSGSSSEKISAFGAYRIIT